MRKMNLFRYVCVIVVLFVHSEAGGHGKKHHDHVRLHVPEFIHHDRHTKVITIHHHHHKPKKEHHHHHHHHPKPHIPHIPHSHHQHHHNKVSIHTVSKGHSSHGHKGHHGHHGHHSHHGHHGHHGHEHKHHDAPSFSYDPPTPNYVPPSTNYDSSSSFGDDFGSHIPSVSSIPQAPHVHGVVHTVKQVKVFDSLPGSLTGNAAGSSGANGYQVTEEANEGEDDVFTSVNTGPQNYPGTFAFLRSAAGNQQNDPFTTIQQQNFVQPQSHDPFVTAAQPSSYANIENFSSQNDPFASSAPSGEGLSDTESSQYPSNLSSLNDFDDPANIIVGNDIGNTAHLSSADGINEETPVTFSREAGVQQSYNTGGVESFVY